MKKLFTALIALLSLVSFNANADTVVFYSNPSVTLPTGGKNVLVESATAIKNGVTAADAVSMQSTGGSVGASYWMFLANNVVTFTQSTGCTISKIDIKLEKAYTTSSTTKDPSFSPGTTTISADKTNITWEGTASQDGTIVLTAGTMIRILYIEVTYTSSGSEPTLEPTTWTLTVPSETIYINDTVDFATWLSIPDSEKDLTFEYWLTQPGYSAKKLETSTAKLNIAGKNSIKIVSLANDVYDSGSITKEFTVEPKQMPSWTVTTSRVAYSVGTSVDVSSFLKVTANDEKKLTFTYSIQPANDPTATPTPIEKGSDDTYNYTFNEAGTFRIWITSAGTETFDEKSADVTVEVGQTPGWTFPSQNSVTTGTKLSSLVTVPDGQSYTFSCTVTPQGGTAQTPDFSTYSFATAGTYEVEVSSAADGTYVSKTETATITVTTAPALNPGWTITKPENVVQGESLVLSDLVKVPTDEEGKYKLYYKITDPAGTVTRRDVGQSYQFQSEGNYIFTVNNYGVNNVIAKEESITIEVTAKTLLPTTWKLKDKTTVTIGNAKQPRSLMNVPEAEKTLTFTYTIKVPGQETVESVNGYVDYTFSVEGDYILTVSSAANDVYQASTKTCIISAVYRETSGTFDFTTNPSYGMSSLTGDNYETTVKQIPLEEGPQMDLTGQYRLTQVQAACGLYIMPGATFTISLPEGVIEKITVHGSSLGDLTAEGGRLTNSQNTECALIPTYQEYGAGYKFTNSGTSPEMRITSIEVEFNSLPRLDMTMFATGTASSWSKNIVVTLDGERFYAEEGNPEDIVVTVAKAEGAEFYEPTQAQLDAIAANDKLSDKITQWDSYFYEGAACSATINDDATEMHISVPCSGKYLVSLGTHGVKWSPATKRAVLNIYPSYDGLRFNWQPANLDKNMACITNPVQGSDGHTYNEKNCRIGVNAFFYQLYYDGTPVVNQEGVDPVSYVAAADSWTVYPASLAPGQGIDLSGFNSLSVKIAKNGVETPAAEVKAITFGTNEEVGVDGIESDANAPAEYYTLSGVRVSGDNLQPGLYILRQGRTVAKVLVK